MSFVMGTWHAVSRDNYGFFLCIHTWECHEKESSLLFNILWLRTWWLSFDFIFIFIYIWNEAKIIIFKCRMLRVRRTMFLIICCFFVFSLDDHLVAAHHYPKDQFRCELCPKSYSYRPSLLRHRALIHGELRKYPCENCSKVNWFFFESLIK